MIPTNITYTTITILQKSDQLKKFNAKRCTLSVARAPSKSHVNVWYLLFLHEFVILILFICLDLAAIDTKEIAPNCYHFKI